MVVRSVTLARKRITKLCAAATHLYGPDLTLSQALSQELTSGVQSLPETQGLPGFGTDLDLVTGDPHLTRTVTSIIEGVFWGDGGTGRRRRPSHLPLTLLTSARLPEDRRLSDAISRAVDTVAVAAGKEGRRPTNRWLKECDNIIGPPSKVPMDAALAMVEWFMDGGGQGPNQAYAAALTGPHGFAALAARIADSGEFKAFAAGRGVTVAANWPRRELGSPRAGEYLTGRAHHPGSRDQWGDSRDIAI